MLISLGPLPQSLATWSARHQLYIESFNYHCLRWSSSPLSIGSTPILVSVPTSQHLLSPRLASPKSLLVSLLNRTRFSFYAAHSRLARHSPSNTGLRPQEDPTY